MNSSKRLNIEPSLRESSSRTLRVTHTCLFEHSLKFNETFKTRKTFSTSQRANQDLTSFSIEDVLFANTIYRSARTTTTLLNINSKKSSNKVSKKKERKEERT